MLKQQSWEQGEMRCPTTPVPRMKPTPIQENNVAPEALFPFSATIFVHHIPYCRVGAYLGKRWGAVKVTINQHMGKFSPTGTQLCSLGVILSPNQLPGPSCSTTGITTVFPVRLPTGMRNIHEQKTVHLHFNLGHLP